MLLSENCGITVMRIEALDLALRAKLGDDYATKHPNLLAAASISVSLERIGDRLSDLSSEQPQTPQSDCTHA
jgi:hypothetical protein